MLKCPLLYGNGQGDPRWLEKAGAWGPQGRLALGVNTKVQGRGCDSLAEPMAGESRAGWLGPGWGPGSLIHSVGKGCFLTGLLRGRVHSYLGHGKGSVHGPSCYHALSGR